MRRRIGGAKVIGGVHQAAAHQLIPDSVDLDAGEQRVGWTREPVGEGFEFIRRKPTPLPSREGNFVRLRVSLLPSLGGVGGGFTEFPCVIRHA